MTTLLVNGSKVTSNFFNGFNWVNFDFGDIVWTEDCEEVDAICCYFNSDENELYNESGMVELVKVDNKAAEIAIKHNLISVHQLF